MAKNFYATMDSPLGELLMTSNGEALTGLYTAKNSDFKKAKTGIHDEKKFAEAIKQLKEYFAGKRSEFDLPLELNGTAFQKKVWKALSEIEFGTTVSYGLLAKKLGKPKAARAVGSANGRNPVCVIIPCHRVVNANGDLGGYNGGVAVKKWLLKHEMK